MGEVQSHRVGRMAEVGDEFSEVQSHKEFEGVGRGGEVEGGGKEGDVEATSRFFDAFFEPAELRRALLGGSGGRAGKGDCLGGFGSRRRRGGGNRGSLAAALGQVWLGNFPLFC